MICGNWVRVTKFDRRALALYERHYSARHYADGRVRRQFCPPGETMVLLTPTCDAVFAWVHNTVPRYDRQLGVNCTLFRNEGQTRSSDLVKEASELAQTRWPGMRLFTYVADGKIRSTNPGYCFKQAGWKRCGRNADGRLTILELLPEAA